MGINVKFPVLKTLIIFCPGVITLRVPIKILKLPVKVKANSLPKWYDNILEKINKTSNDKFQAINKYIN
jgi:hypothetical protein